MKQTLAATFSRVVSVVSGGSKPDDMPVQVQSLVPDVIVILFQR
jgi:hypothetical protein